MPSAKRRRRRRRCAQRAVEVLEPDGAACNLLQPLKLLCGGRRPLRGCFLGARLAAVVWAEPVDACARLGEACGDASVVVHIVAAVTHVHRVATPAIATISAPVTVPIGCARWVQWQHAHDTHHPIGFDDKTLAQSIWVDAASVFAVVLVALAWAETSMRSIQVANTRPVVALLFGLACKLLHKLRIRVRIPRGWGWGRCGGGPGLEHSRRHHLRRRTARGYRDSRPTSLCPSERLDRERL